VHTNIKAYISSEQSAPVLSSVPKPHAAEKTEKTRGYEQKATKAHKGTKEILNKGGWRGLKEHFRKKKKKNLSSFIHAHFIPNLYEFCCKLVRKGDV